MSGRVVTLMIAGLLVFPSKDDDAADVAQAHGTGMLVLRGGPRQTGACQLSPVIESGVKV